MMMKLLHTIFYKYNVISMTITLRWQVKMKELIVINRFDTVL